MKTVTIAETNVRQAIGQAFLNEFPEDRVVCLLGYGSMVDGRSRESDVDTYLLLDEWHKHDVETARQAADTIGHPVDLTLHYANELPGKPEHFRLGKKSCMALAYLASADTIHGTNVPAEMFEDLPHRALQISALHTVFYYLGQMRKEQSTLTDEAYINRHMDKYLARSIIDAMMFYRKTTYEPFKHLANNEVVEQAKDHPHIGPVFAGTSEIETNLGKLEFMHRLHGQLRLANWLIAKELDQSAFSQVSLAMDEH